MEELIGDVTKIVFRNIENGWTVLRLDSKLGGVLATGSLASIHEGEYVRFLGNWTHHKTYGQQFKIERKGSHNTEEGIKRYLSSRLIKGIGVKTSAKIVDYFGIETLDILDNHPSRLEEVPSIGKKKIRAILAAWESHRQDRTVELFLISGQLSPKLATKILSFYGKKTMEVLTKNPYRLAIDIRGVGFHSADRFAQSLGISPDAPERIQAAIAHTIKKGEVNGHCFQTTQDLIDGLKDSLKVEEDTLIRSVPPSLADLNQSGHIVSANYTESNAEATTAHYYAPTFDKEVSLADNIKDLLGKPLEFDAAKIDRWIKHHCNGENINLSDEQIRAVSEAARHRIFILTGGPGVGKSTTANIIIKLLTELGLEVALGAPTGRAAQRLKEVTNQPAKTIHRLLEWNPKENGFKKNKEDPLTARAIIIDEVSMLDLPLAHHLIEAVDPKSQLILIGDVDQLPSVGVGNVLRDLIDSKRVPFVKLTQIFRQAAQSDIVQISHKINQGDIPTFTNLKESDCRFIEVPTAEGTVEVIKKLLTEALPKRAGYDPIRDVQILTPMKKSDTGTENLNNIIQELLNPRTHDMHEHKNNKGTLRPGDKVIQNSNNYDLGVYNGDIGYVQDTGISGGQLLIKFGTKEVTYSSEAAESLGLAYSITIHKAQGSEFPVVIIPITSQHHIMLQRNLIYTALTRAKKLAIFVGTTKALKTAIDTQISIKRRTNLAHRLQQPSL